MSDLGVLLKEMSDLRREIGELAACLKEVRPMRARRADGCVTATEAARILGVSRKTFYSNCLPLLTRRAAGFARIEVERLRAQRETGKRRRA